MTILCLPLRAPSPPCQLRVRTTLSFVPSRSTPERSTSGCRTTRPLSMSATRCSGPPGTHGSGNADDVEAVPGVDACVRPHITEVADHFLALSTREACEGVRICAKGDGLKGVHERYGRRCETNCNLR